MASLQELRKRLRSIQSTGQLAGAMRTAATAKYAKVSRVRDEFTPYARACRDMLRLLGAAGIEREAELTAPRDCLVILGGNRGLCGGFNAELLRYLDEELKKHESPLLLVCGRKAALYLRERGVPFEDYPLSDVPTYDEIRPLVKRLRELYVTGKVERVLVVYQSFRNMLTQIPATEQLLPESEPDGEESYTQPLFLPDRETIGAQLAVSCVDAQMFDLALENSAGAQTPIRSGTFCSSRTASGTMVQ